MEWSLRDAFFLSQVVEEFWIHLCTEFLKIIGDCAVREGVREAPSKSGDHRENSMVLVDYGRLLSDLASKLKVAQYGGKMESGLSTLVSPYPLNFCVLTLYK